MLTGERRGISARRGGMTVLGKVAVPKPVNLPSQRLENRGLDPNVEIVPKGTVSWRSAGRSPPTSGNAWGTVPSSSSSPPTNAGLWSRSHVSTNRPSSGGSGTRPSTAGSDQSHEAVTPNAWGSVPNRPSSASASMGLAHSQSTVTRPCSAESRLGSSQLSRFADSSVEAGGVWGGSGTAQKLGENHPQPTQFTLTSVDFPTLGSDKNPDLRPQHGNASIRSVSTSEGLALEKERPRSSPAGWGEDASTGTPTGQDRGTVDTWKRELSYPGEMPVPDEGHAQRGDLHRPSYGSLPHTSDSWHCDDGHRTMASSVGEGDWHRGGPPVGPYCPPGGPGRFPLNPSGYMRPPFEFGPVPYAPGPSGPGTYNRHGEIYGPFMRQPTMVPGRPGLPLGHGMYPNQMPYDGYYGPPGVGGPNYGSIDERDMAMLRMGGGPGMYGGYPHHQGPLEAPRFRHGGPSSGSHPASFHSAMPREHNDASAYNRAAGEGAEKAFPKQSDGWVPKDAEISRDNSRPFFSRDANLRRNPVVPTNISQRESSNPRGSTSGHRDWGAAVNIDEPMDFSKPVFDEEDLSRQGFVQDNASGMGNDSGPEKGAKMQRVVEVIRDKRNIQVKNRDIGDSRKYSASDDVSRVGKGNGTEVDGGKAVQLEGQFPVGQEYPSEAGGVSIGKRNYVGRSVDDKIQGEDLEINTSLQVGEKWAYGGGEAISSTQKSAYTVDRSHDLGERAQASVKSLKTLDQQGPTDGPKRVSVVSTPSERDSALNTTAKLTGGLSSAAGLNDVPCETLQNRDKGDKVHLLKRSDNHTAHNMMDTEEVMEKVQENRGASGTQEVPGKEGHRMKSRFNVHEGDNEWRRKGPAVEPLIKASKVNDMTSSNASSNQISSFSVSGSSTAVPGTSSDKQAGDSQVQQSVDSYDYEVQRARMKEIAAQRAKQLQREEEERTKEQKAKALAKLEELNRRAFTGAVSQDVGHPKQEDPTKLNNGSEVTSDIQEQQAVNFEGKNPGLENNAGDNESVAGQSIGHPGEIDKGKSENDQRISNVSREDQKSQMNLLEQKDLVKGGASGSNNNAKCEAPVVQVSSSSEIPGRLGKNADDSLGQSGKYEKGKQENYRRIGSFNRENPRSQMKMDDKEDLVKERVSLPNSSTTSDAPVLPISATQVSGAVLTFPGTSEVLHQDVPLPESVSPRNTDQFRQRGFPKQIQMRHKVKQYATQQRFSGPQQSMLDKTEQCVAPENGPSAQPVSEHNGMIVSNYVADEKNTPDASFGLAISASGSDGVPISRKKKNNRNIKGKQKPERHVNISSVGSAEHDLSKIAQPNSTDRESKQEVEEVNSDFVKPPGFSDSNKDAYIHTGKSELASVESVEDDVSVAPKDALASDARLSESMGDTSLGRMPHLKSQLSKRSYKGSQDARVLEKFQGNEGRVWAPVRSVNHNGAGYDNKNDNKKLHQSGAEVQPSGDTNNELVGQNPIRNRRAEMERYVPKPVAKEQAQHQENNQQSAGASVSAQFHTAHSSFQQGTPQNSQTVPLRQQHSYAGGNRGNGIGNKHGKPNVSWRQRNSNEISENKDSSAHSNSEVERVSSVQVNEATETWQAHGQTQNLKSEGPRIHLPSEQLNVHKARHVDQLPKPTSAQANRQHSPHSEVDQGSQFPTVPHLQESIAVKEHDLQLASKREQNTHERFYQANRSRSKLNKSAVRQSNTEGNHHTLASEFNIPEGVNDEREKNRLMEQIYPHQRPRPSGSWTPRQQGPTDDKEHLLPQQTKSVVQTDVGQVTVGSHDEHQRLQRQSSQQTRLSSTQYSKAVAHRQETSESSVKQQHMQDLSSWEQSVSPHHPLGKKEGPYLDAKLQTNHIPQQQSMSTHMDRQEADKDQQKQAPNSTLYQQRQQSSAQSHWQQTGANSSAGVPRRTDGHEEHLRSTATQSLKQQGAPVPRTESSHGAGQYHRQDTNRHQAHINSDSKKQNSQVQSQPVSHQKAQEFYQPKPRSASGQGYKHEISHSTTSQNSSPWAGDHKSGPVYHDRDHNHARRGRPGGRSGGGSVARGIESESKSENPSKQRLVIDATGGAVPNQIVS